MNEEVEFEESSTNRPVFNRSYLPRKKSFMVDWLISKRWVQTEAGANHFILSIAGILFLLTVYLVIHSTTSHKTSGRPLTPQEIQTLPPELRGP
ncbi:MAG TPA: hypothetical protein VFA52_02300 [Candidatus Paceibacterota bacterium]|nr:hypothetical protein [Candidatus Paceibacterota bacterium]